MQKSAIVMVLLVLMVFPASSDGFGIVPGNQDHKIKDLNTNLSIGLVNLGDTTRDVSIGFQTNENFEVEPNNMDITLDPSVIRTSPGEGRWFSTGGGRYAKMRQVDVKMVINSSSSVRNFSVPVTVTSRPLREERIASTGQKVYQQRKTVFNVYTTSEILQTEDGVLYEEGELFTSNRSQKVEGRDEKSSVNESADMKQPEKGLTGETENSNEAINSWTVLLVAGIAFSLAVIWSEI